MNYQKYLKMSKPKSNKEKLAELKKEEKRLFDIYNRHANAETKIAILSAKIKVIQEIQELEK